MEAKLILVGGKANKTEVSLRLPTTIGRSRDADLTIAHPMVSRRHCQLFEDNGVLMVRDLGSLNGTAVRRQRISEPVPLRPNDELTVGPITFRAQYEHVGEIALPPSMEPAAAEALDFLAMPDQGPPGQAPDAAPEVVTSPEQARGAAPETAFIPPPPGEFGGEMSDFGAWADADSGQGSNGSEPTPPASMAKPAAPGDWPTAAGAPAATEGPMVEGPPLEFPELGAESEPPAAPAEPPAQPESDFSLGPAPSEDLDELFFADLDGPVPGEPAPADSAEKGNPPQASGAASPLRPPALPSRGPGSGK